MLGGSSICNCSVAQTEPEHRETEICRVSEMNLTKILCSSTELGGITGIRMRRSSKDLINPDGKTNCDKQN